MPLSIVKLFPPALLALALAGAFRGCPDASPNVSYHAMAHDGRERAYRLHLPSTYADTAPASLVMILHPFTGTHRSMARLTGFDALSEREGFIAVYPQGVQRRWNNGGPPGAPGPFGLGFANADDGGFLAALLDRLQADYAIDEDRVYLAGASNGGFMTYRMLCELDGVFAAAAVVMGSMPAALAADCAPGSATPLLLIHGTDDPAVPFEGGAPGGGPGGPFLSARDTAAFWAARNGCAAAPTVTPLPERDPADGTRVVVEAYSDCAGDAPVTLYVIEGGGHTWPGQPRGWPRQVVGVVSQEIDASEVIWTFFQEFTRSP